MWVRLFQSGMTRSPKGPRAALAKGRRDIDEPQDGGGGLPTRQGPLARDAQRIPLDPTEVGQVGGGVPVDQLRRRDVREFLDWVREQAVKDEGTNPGRTANKAREQLRAILS
jgi:hypothetical protein